MNVLDSELAAAALLSAGCKQVSDARRADLILFNTCSVREHAEEKIYSALGRLKHWKINHPNGIIGVMGCMAQKDREIIFRRAPHVDLVLGPGQLDRLLDLLKTIDAGNRPQIEVSRDRFARSAPAADIRESFHPYDPIRLEQARPNPFQAMVRIMFGCDQFCSYCIVPQVRGPEQSRPAADIIRETEKLAAQGVKEIMLLGQTVNHYRDKSSETRLPELLEKINEIDGIERIRFVSNYPTGMSDELLRAVHDLPKAMPSLHVPAQHGADSVLERMRRRYTAGQYMELIDRIGEQVPEASVTSDFIVGFCGETEEEFEQTAALIRRARFKNSFIFKYSPRTGTRSAELYADDVPESVKRRRNNALLDVQTEVSHAENKRLVGQNVTVLVEGMSKIAKKQEEFSGDALPLATNESPCGSASGDESVQLTGRTPCDRIVVFDGPASLTGSLATIKIIAAAPFTLFGRKTDSPQV